MEEIRELLRRIGVWFESEMMATHESGSDATPNAHQNLDHFSLLDRPIDSSRAYAWKKELSDRKIADVEKVAAPLMEELDLQQALEKMGFQYACRTALSTLVEDSSGEVFPAGEPHPFSGQRYAVLQGASVAGRRYGPLQVIFWHEDDHDNGVPLVTNLELAEEAIRFYKRRFQIETLFSDRKSRGFHAHKSHISAPDRLARLLMAGSLAVPVDDLSRGQELAAWLVSAVSSHFTGGPEPVSIGTAPA